MTKRAKSQTSLSNKTNRHTHTVLRRKGVAKQVIQKRKNLEINHPQ